MSYLSVLITSKNILVIDPIEIKGININHSSNIYLLFQIGTNANRSKVIQADKASLGWNEDSQCKFMVDHNTSILKIFLMEKTRYIPGVLARAEFNLTEVLKSKKSNIYLNLSPAGILDLEITLYSRSPTIPEKISRVGSQQTLVTPNIETKIEPSSHKIFEAHSEKIEINRLERLVSRVKKHYKASVKSNYELKSRTTSEDMSMKEIMSSKTLVASNPNVVTQKSKRLPVLPDEFSLLTPSTVHHTHCPSENSPERQSFDFVNSGTDFFDINISGIPFSADSIGSENPSKMDQLKHKSLNEKKSKTNYEKLSPEKYSLFQKLRAKSINPEVLRIDPGLSEYNGKGSWSRDNIKPWNYNVSENKCPKIPPKITLGMTDEEFFAINHEKYMSYVQTIMNVHDQKY
ncbi:hypothetical protein WICMUC_001145 [Wickerhamomyces mucosus]|uniref:Uncharacterized protein n=1 Tax=Wickerhamomyces mucosus TaxID=1378264 RepID=A0A9P8PWZ7_9ASCO|nr:hypothetical protein WICMUC_001145 [Wickerhamomyces mucosus]